MNPLWPRIHRFLWCIRIRVIWDRWPWSESSQRNAPFVWLYAVFNIFCDYPLIAWGDLYKHCNFLLVYFLHRSLVDGNGINSSVLFFPFPFKFTLVTYIICSVIICHGAVFLYGKKLSIFLLCDVWCTCKAVSQSSWSAKWSSTCFVVPS